MSDPRDREPIRDLPLLAAANDAARLRVEVTVLRERVTALACWAQEMARAADEAGYNGGVAEVAALVDRLQPESVAAEVAERIARGEVR